MEQFRDTMTVADLMDSATDSVIAGSWYRLGQYVVPAGELVSVGFGTDSSQANATGRVYMIIKNGAGTEIAGKVRLSVYSPQDRPLGILGEWRTNIINANATDRTKQLPLPRSAGWIPKDKKLVLEFLPDVSDAALTKANCLILLDVTKGVA